MNAPFKRRKGAISRRPRLNWGSAPNWNVGGGYDFTGTNYTKGRDSGPLMEAKSASGRLKRQRATAAPRPERKRATGDSN